MSTYTIALAGNPNAGKSTLFNLLTHSHQHVGNWPGKTVEKQSGIYHYGEYEFLIIDLPGTYSLSTWSPEEEIARDFIVREHPDVVINVVDATNLERNLYLTVQILETGAPLILALNMMDRSDAQGIHVNVGALSDALGGIPVIPMVAQKQRGIGELTAAIARVVGIETATTAPYVASTRHEELAL